MLPLIIGGLSAGSALAGDIIERNAAKKAKQDAINAYTKLLIPTSETETRADRAGDTLYTKAMSELNSGAFAARGALNPETLKTIAYTKMAGARAETEFQVGEEDYKYNKGIQQQIAQIESQPVPTINPLNAIEAGVGGYFAGKQLEMAEDLTEAQKSFMKAQEDYYGGGNKAKSPLGVSTSPTNNNYFNNNKVGNINLPNIKPIDDFQPTPYSEYGFTLGESSTDNINLRRPINNITEYIRPLEDLKKGKPKFNIKNKNLDLSIF